MAMKERVLSWIGWGRHFEIGRRSRWGFWPDLRAGLIYRRALVVGPWVLMFGAKAEEERESSMASAMAEASDLLEDINWEGDPRSSDQDPSAVP
jgi:hypothetical protein